MGRLLLTCALCIFLLFALAGPAAAAPILAGNEAGTTSVYVESFFGIIYFGGVTYNLAKGSGLGIGTLLNSDYSFQIYWVNGTLGIGALALDVQALTNLDFQQYLGQAGAYLKLDLGALDFYPGIGVFFVKDFLGGGEAYTDPFYSFELQLKAGNVTLYGDALKPIGSPGLGTLRFGASLAF